MAGPTVRRSSAVRLALWVAVAAVAIVVATLLGLIAAGTLVLPTGSTAPFTVTVVHWTIDQGETSTGVGWTGPSQFNYTGGFPATFAPGGTISLIWTFSNHDSQSHSIVGILVNAPFVYESASPGLPVAIPAGWDDAALQVTIGVPHDPGASMALEITVNVI